MTCLARFNKLIMALSRLLARINVEHEYYKGTRYTQIQYAFHIIKRQATQFGLR